MTDKLKVDIPKHIKGYKEQMDGYIELLKKSAFSPEKKREMLNEWKEFFEAEQVDKLKNIHWLKDVKFKDPEYRIHPLMGYQVRSRHVFEPECVKQPQSGKAHQKGVGSPKEFDPFLLEQYRKGSLTGTVHSKKGFKVTLEDEPEFHNTDFRKVKSARTRRALEILEFRAGFDSKSNKHVLYSPLKLNDKWDVMSQAFWYRSIGMSPKTIALVLKTSYNTVKTWLKNLTKFPLVHTKTGDWGTGYREKGGYRPFGAGSTVDAPKHQYPRGEVDDDR